MKTSLLKTYLSAAIILLGTYNGFVFAQNSQTDKQAEIVTACWQKAITQLQQQVGASNDDFSAFLQYNTSKFSLDHRSFNAWAELGNIDVLTARSYLRGIEKKYRILYNQFLNQRKNNVAINKPMANCNPKDSNIGFENGTLTGWNAYYAINNSTSSSHTITGITGGPCASVTAAANDPNTNMTGAPADYQVEIMSGGTDPLVPSTTRVNPAGGKYSVRLGDSTNPNQGVAMLSQSFTVNANNAAFTYSYALFLENPAGHTFYEQPFFQVVFLDQKGDTIPCNSLRINATGANKAGFDSVLYAANGDYVYYNNWTTVSAPLVNYVGQCVTVQFIVADCALGGHFGYAYIDAAIAPMAITPSAPGICSGTITLTAPAGAASYAWAGPCISGSATAQTITISCAGTYKVTMKRTGASCTDTLSINVPANGGTATVTSTPYYCTADEGTASASTTVSTPPYSYSWSNGQTTSSISGLAAGTYSVSVENGNGCIETNTVTIASTPISLSTSTNATSVFPNDSVILSCKINDSAAAAYTYSWSPAASVTHPNSQVTYAHPKGTTVYTVTVTTPCGIMTDTVTIHSKCALGASASSTPFYCSADAGTAAVTTLMGASPYTYLWNNGQTTSNISGINAGKYWITVKDANGCTASDTTIVTATTLTVTASASLRTIEVGDSTYLSEAINDPASNTFTYSWTPSSGVTNPNSASTSAHPVTATTYTVTVTTPCGIISDTVSVKIGCSVKASTLSVGYDCATAQGSATASAANGIAPYTYIWTGGSTSTSISNLTAGSYTVHVTDHSGCTDSSVAIIGTDKPLTLKATAFPVSCNGSCNGQIVVVPSGGVLPYNYMWSNGQTVAGMSNLCAGTYSVIVTDARGCQADTNPLIVTQPTLVVNTPGPPQTICIGQSATISVSASGGTGPYTYSWSPGGMMGSPISVSPVVTETYTVTASDANMCPAALVTVVVSVNPPISIVTTPPRSMCAGGMTSICATASGGDGIYTYTWLPGNITGNCINVSPATTNYYTVIVSDACSSPIAKDSTGVIIRNPKIIIDSNIMGNCNSSLWVVMNDSGGAPFSYIWNTTPPQTTDTATGLCKGTYTVTVTDDSGCVAIDSIIVVDPNGINELQNNVSFNIYPVPASNKLNIQLSNGYTLPSNSIIEIYDITGRELINEKISSNKNIITIDVSMLDNGTYILMFGNDTSRQQARFTIVR